MELEDYEVRRLPMALNTLADYVRANPLYTDGSGNAINVGLQVRNLKRRIMQDIINAEFPRPRVKVDGSNNPIRDADGNLTFEFNEGLGIFPTNIRAATGTIGFSQWLFVNYKGLEKPLRNVSSSRVVAWLSFRKSMSEDPMARNYFKNFNLPGEYLYQTLAFLDFDGAPAIESLGNQAIGDSDDDGFLEVVDAWGDPLQLRIWQVDAVEVDSSDVPLDPQKPQLTTDIWRDVPGFDFDIKDGDGVPQGYSVIDPIVPREIGKIRFEVVSTRLVY